jgi:hypothetical protein
MRSNGCEVEGIVATSCLSWCVVHCFGFSKEEKMSITLKFAIVCVREEEMPVLKVNWPVLLHNVHFTCFPCTWPGFCVRGLLSRFLDASAVVSFRAFAILTRRLQHESH